MDWQEYFQSPREMVQTINARLEREKELIRYVNLRYRLYGQAETKWLYDVTLKLQGEDLQLEKMCIRDRCTAIRSSRNWPRVRSRRLK